MRLVEIRYSDDTLSVDTYGNEFLDIEMDQPWYGDSETGFGVTLSQTLTQEQAKELADTIYKWLEGRK